MYQSLLPSGIILVIIVVTGASVSIFIMRLQRVEQRDPAGLLLFDRGRVQSHGHGTLRPKFGGAFQRLWKAPLAQNSSHYSGPND